MAQPFVGSGVPLKGVGPEHIRENAVRTEHILDGTITLADLATALQALLIPTGSIIMWGGAAAPTEWFLCDGTAKSRTTEAALFAIYGTAFGVGDGSTTFNLPDLRQRFPLGKAAAGTGATLGGTGGSIDHVHDLDTASSGARLGTETAADIIYHQRKTIASYTDVTVSDAGTIAFSNSAVARTLGTALTGDTDSDNPPFQVVNFICKR